MTLAEHAGRQMRILFKDCGEIGGGKETAGFCDFINF